MEARTAWPQSNGASTGRRLPYGMMANDSTKAPMNDTMKAWLTPGHSSTSMAIITTRFLSLIGSFIGFL